MARIRTHTLRVYKWKHRCGQITANTGLWTFKYAYMNCGPTLCAFLVHTLASTWELFTLNCVQRPVLQWTVFFRFNFFSANVLSVSTDYYSFFSIWVVSVEDLLRTVVSRGTVGKKRWIISRSKTQLLLFSFFSFGVFISFCYFLKHICFIYKQRLKDVGITCC